MDFDYEKMRSISTEQMEFNSVISSGSWFEADDCGSDCDCDDNN